MGHVKCYANLEPDISNATCVYISVFLFLHDNYSTVYTYDMRHGLICFLVH